jgi:hypothetical protein
MIAAREIWIASRSLSSGAHSRDPLARNDEKGGRRAFTTSARGNGPLLAAFAKASAALDLKPGEALA